jgi:hypothetical protein
VLLVAGLLLAQAGGEGDTTAPNPPPRQSPTQDETRSPADPKAEVRRAYVRQ